MSYVLLLRVLVARQAPQRRAVQVRRGTLRSPPPPHARSAHFGHRGGTSGQRQPSRDWAQGIRYPMPSALRSAVSRSPITHSSPVIPPRRVGDGGARSPRRTSGPDPPGLRRFGGQSPDRARDATPESRAIGGGRFVRSLRAHIGVIAVSVGGVRGPTLRHHRRSRVPRVARVMREKCEHGDEGLPVHTLDQRAWAPLGAKGGNGHMGGAPVAGRARR